MEIIVPLRMLLGFTIARIWDICIERKVDGKKQLVCFCCVVLECCLIMRLPPLSFPCVVLLPFNCLPISGFFNASVDISSAPLLTTTLFCRLATNLTCEEILTCQYSCSTHKFEEFAFDIPILLDIEIRQV